MTEGDCSGVDMYTQLSQVMSDHLLTLPAGLDPREAFDRLHGGGTGSPRSSTAKAAWSAS